MSGTTSCNLAITNSHRLAKEIQSKFLELNIDLDKDFVDSTIKISGCPNSCGQHEVATIGFYGGATRIGTSMVPIYTMLFAGSTGENGELGKAIMRVPAKKVLDVVLKIFEYFKKERTGNEKLNEWIYKISNGNGDGEIKNVDDMKKTTFTYNRITCIFRQHLIFTKIMEPIPILSQKLLEANVLLEQIHKAKEK